MSLDASSSIDDAPADRSAGTAGSSPSGSSYVIPRYRSEDAAFYHVLHGNVPGHQIDFMYLPEVPQGALRQTHVGHLARLIKYIEPRESVAYAFAIGNLSRDVRHDPAHGGLAILFALRVPGVVDHAGRDTPPYAHAVIAVDRHLDYTTLLESTTVLYRRFLEREGAEDRRGDFYRSYVRAMREAPARVPEFLAKAIAEHDDLPLPPKSKLTWDYAVDDEDPHRQITIVHDEPMDFGSLAHWASTLGAILYRSNIKWTTVSTGREMDIVGGTSVRFVPRSEAQTGQRGPTFELDDLPEDDDSIARLLFGAKRRGVVAAAPKQGWREAMAAQRSPRSEPPPADQSISVDVDDAAATLPVASPLDAARAFDPRRSSPVSGQAVVQLGAAGTAAAPLPASSVAGNLPAEVTPNAPDGVLPHASSPAPAPPASIAVHSVRDPDLLPLPRSGLSKQRGKWIIVGAVLAAVAVVVVVAVAVGMGASEGGGPNGSASGAFSGDSQGTMTAPTATTAPAATSTMVVTTPPGPTASAVPSATPSSTSNAPKASATSSSSGPRKPSGKLKPPVF